MKRMKKLAGFMLLAITVTTSCTTDRTREDQVSAIINKVDDPFLVINAQPEGLIEKSGALDGALPFTYEMLLNFFIDEEVTGVDYDTDVQVIVGKGLSFAPNFYGIFKVKNENVFIELIETEANAEVEEKDGFKYAIKESDQYVIVWNESFAVASNIPIDFAAMFSGGGSDDGMKAVNKNIELIKAAEEGDTNEDYVAFLKNESDIAVHFDGTGFYKYLEEMTMEENEELKKNKERLEGVNSDLFINFNNGSIVLDMVSNLSDELKEEYSFIAESGVSTDLLSFGKSANPLMSLSYNMEVGKMLEYMEENMDDRDYENFEEGIQELGLTVDEAKEALSGEALFIIDGVEMETYEVDWGYGDPYIETRPNPVFAVVMGVSDKDKIAKVMTAGGEATEGMENGVVKNGDAYLFLNDQVLFTTNDSTWAMAVAAGEKQAIANNENILTEKPFGLWAELGSVGELVEDKGVREVLDLVDHIKGSATIDNAVLSIMFKDDSQNALRLITEALANLSNEVEGQDELEAELEEAIMMESALEEIPDEAVLEVIEEAMEAIPDEAGEAIAE